MVKLWFVSPLTKAFSKSYLSVLEFGFSEGGQNFSAPLVYKNLLKLARLEKMHMKFLFGPFHCIGLYQSGRCESCRSTLI